MKTPKVLWRVQQAPTGKYRTFESRGWPWAHYKNGRPAIALYCSGYAYSPRAIKAGTKYLFRLMVANHKPGDGSAFRWVEFSGKYPMTLEEVKKIAEELLATHQEFWPEDADSTPAPPRVRLTTEEKLRKLVKAVQAHQADTRYSDTPKHLAECDATLYKVLAEVTAP